jgi:hypothetical protein
MSNISRQKLDTMLFDTSGILLAEIDIKVPAPNNDLARWWYTAHDCDYKPVILQRW